MAEKFGIDLSNISLKKFKPRSEDTVRSILMSLGSLSDKKLGDIEKRLKGLNGSDLNNLKSLIDKEENVLQRLNLVYQAMAKADEDSLIKERKFTVPRINENFHGTGCTFSTAIACNIINQHKIEDCVKIALSYMQKTISSSKISGIKQSFLNRSLK